MLKLKLTTQTGAKGKVYRELTVCVCVIFNSRQTNFTGDWKNIHRIAHLGCFIINDFYFKSAVWMLCGMEG